MLLMLEKYPVYTVGTTLDELKFNITEALNLYFKAQGKTITETDLKIARVGNMLLFACY